MNDQEFSETMREWHRVYDMHKALQRAFEPLIRDYYGKAVHVDPRQFTDMSVDDMVKQFPFTLPRHEDGRINTDVEEFENWRQAAFLDTMARCQIETTGGDDSVFDYLPDGIEQLAGLANFEAADWLDEATKSLTQFRETHVDDGPYFMDCTSPILWQVINDDDEDDE